MIKSIRNRTLFLATCATVSLLQAESGGERSFTNGVAVRTYGNVYVVRNYSGEGAQELDKDGDGGDGPQKGEVIGLTAAEKKEKKEKIIFTEG